MLFNATLLKDANSQSKRQQITRNSSGDEIANVNFLYNDIIHAVQNTIDLCIHSAKHRCGYCNTGLQNSVK